MVQKFSFDYRLLVARDTYTIENILKSIFILFADSYIIISVSATENLLRIPFYSQCDFWRTHGIEFLTNQRIHDVGNKSSIWLFVCA